MKIQITGRQVKITDAMRSFTEEKLDHIQKYSLKIQSVHVLMSVQKETHKCEINMNAKNLNLNAQAASKNMYESITKCVDKLEHQIQHHKISHHDKRNRVATASFDQVVQEQLENMPISETA